MSPLGSSRVSTIRSRRGALAAALVALGACGGAEVDPVPATPAAPAAPAAVPPGQPGERLLGRWQVPEPTLPPTTIDLARDGGATTAHVWLSGVTYSGAAVGDDTSVVVYQGDRAAIRGVLQAGGDRLGIRFLGAEGQVVFTQVLAKVR